MRARLAILASGQVVELREVVLKDKPAELIDASPKATVPVLVLLEQVVDESVEIMQWALNLSDPNGWLAPVSSELLNHALIVANDQEFKPALDKYKYFDRFPERSQDDYLLEALPFLTRLDNELAQHQGHLVSPNFSAIDAAIFPFIRQFANCDLARFEALGLKHLNDWLQRCLTLPLFETSMRKFEAWSSELDNGIRFSSK